MPAQPSKKSFKDTIRFPSIPRFITERSLAFIKSVFFGLTVTFLIFAILIRLAQLRQGVIIMQENSLKRQEIVTEKNYWEDVLKRHPGYRDASFKLAVLSLRLGQRDEARKYSNLTLQIDPNFKEGRIFAQKLRF